MKKYFIHIAALSLMAAMACQKPINLASEEEAIKEVIKQQNDANNKHNLEGEAAVWAHEPYVLRIVRTTTVGWDSVNAYYKRLFAKPQNQTKQIVTYSDFKIRISGSSAWAVFDQNIDYESNGKKQSGKTMEIRFFEKTEGQWKIVLQITGSQSGY